MAAQDWVSEHGASLVGTSVREAVAPVREAGLTPRTILVGSITTLEFRPDRVDLIHDADGVVTEVRAG